MKTIIEMTRELGGFAPTTKFLERFAELVRADQRADLYKEIHDPLVLACKKMVADEREACAKVCEQSEIPIPIDVWHGSTKKEMTEHTALALAKAIRARGNT